MLTNLLSKLSSRQNERQQTAEETYRQTVRAIAAGDEPDVAEVEAVLQAAGKTADELAAAVDLIRRREHWREIVAGEPELKREAADLVVRREAARETLKQAQIEFDQTIADIREQEFRVQRDLRECEDARRQLNNSAPPELVAAQRSLPTKKCYEALQVAELELREAESQLAGLERERQNGKAPINVDSLIASQKMVVVSRTVCVENLRSELKRLQADGERLSREVIAA